MRAPVLAVGDGALGFWACAARGVARDPRPALLGAQGRQRARNALPKSVQPTARRMLAEIRDAEDRDHAVDRRSTPFDCRVRRQVAQGGRQDRRRPRALLAFYDFPAEHWLHLKTTNPIESTFSTVRLRTKVTKGPGSRAAGLAMAFKLIEAAQDRWRAVNGPHLVLPSSAPTAVTAVRITSATA